MKNLIASIAFAFAFTLPFMDSTLADPNYMVAKSNTNIWEYSFKRGNVKCTVQIGDQVYRSWGLNWSRWIHVDVMVGSISSSRCKGWVDKMKLETLAETPNGIREQEKRLKRLNETASGN